jgi:putative ubiquitin-RnfH superfamily antitoxin RatB of RatAB toxin-antitoxin module
MRLRKEQSRFMANKINIEVAYAQPEKQSLLSVVIDDGLTVEQAIMHSDIINLHPEIDLNVNKVGIWNRTCKLQDLVKDGDRIEVYRPLIADPKEVRKRRAEKAKQEGRADKVTGGRPNALKKS